MLNFAAYPILTVLFLALVLFALWFAMRVIGVVLYNHAVRHDRVMRAWCKGLIMLASVRRNASEGTLSDRDAVEALRLAMEMNELYISSPFWRRWMFDEACSMLIARSNNAQITA